MFDPELFNFIQCDATGGYPEWISLPTEDGLIGDYKLSNDLGWWCLEENWVHNGEKRPLKLYSGRIPSNEFAFELFKNMELVLPIIQREIKIDDIIK